MSAIDPALVATASDADRAGATSYRWVVLLFAWGALLLTFVDRLVWGSVNLVAGPSLGMSIAALGSFFTAFYVGYVVSNLAGGFLTDVLGPRKTLALSLLPLGFCTFLFGTVTTEPQGLALQVLMGIAAGCDYSACVKLVTTWFDQRDRGRAMGLLMTATSLGFLLTNALVPTLLKTQSWGTIYQQFGISTAVFGLSCLLVIRDGPIRADGPREPIDVLAILRNRDLVLLAVAGFGAMWGTWGFTFWANALMIKGHGLSRADAAAIAVLFSVGAIVSKPLIGLLSDLIGGRRKILVLGCFVSFTVLLLIFGSLDSASSFRLVAPLLGVAAFAYSPLTAAMVAEIAGRSLAGSATGATNAFWQLGSVIVPLAVGAVFQSTSSFLAAFVALALGPLLASIGLIFVRELKRF